VADAVALLEAAEAEAQREDPPEQPPTATQEKQET
jgi:hypothetical protein